MNINDNAPTSASQTRRILAYLRQGNRINPIRALGLFGCFRLGARITDIEKITGVAPSRRRVKVTNREGKEVYVAEYWIPKEIHTEL